MFEDINEMVEWFQLTFPEIVEGMQNCSHHYDEQNINPYHIEGDVWTHTMMVCQQGSNTDKILDLCKLLHDIGKFDCRHENHEKKRVSFYNHESYSAFMSLDIMNRLNLSVADKIRVFKLLAMHTEPFKLTRDQLAERCIGQTEFYEDLIRLSTSDKKGRFHKVKEELESFKSVESFIPIKRNRKVTLMIGSPCSGKSSWVKANAKDEMIISRDEILLRLNPGLSYTEAWKVADQKVVDKELQVRFKEARDSKVDIIVDMTHMSRKSRRKTLTHFPIKEFNREAVVCLVDIKTMVKREEVWKEKILKIEEMKKRESSDSILVDLLKTQLIILNKEEVFSTNLISKLINSLKFNSNIAQLAYIHSEKIINKAIRC